MDPNETLKQLRVLVDEDDNLPGEWSADTANERCTRYAQLFGSLDAWISDGGFLPAGWVNHHA